MKHLTQKDIFVTVTVPKTSFTLNLRHLLAVAPATKTPLTREQKIVRWLIALVIAFVLFGCATTAFVTWFLVNYQITF